MGIMTMKAEATEIDGLVILNGRAWVRSVVRKDHPCKLCGGTIGKRQPAYRPLSNGMNRWERVHVRCVSALLER